MAPQAQPEQGQRGAWNADRDASAYTAPPQAQPVPVMAANQNGNRFNTPPYFVDSMMTSADIFAAHAPDNRRGPGERRMPGRQPDAQGGMFGAQSGPAARPAGYPETPVRQAAPVSAPRVSFDTYPDIYREDPRSATSEMFQYSGPNTPLYNLQETRSPRYPDQPAENREYRSDYPDPYGSYTAQAAPYEPGRTGQPWQPGASSAYRETTASVPAQGPSRKGATGDIYRNPYGTAQGMFQPHLFPQTVPSRNAYGEEEGESEMDMWFRT
jgi:hypothetical protein